MKILIDISEDDYKEVLKDAYSGTPFENRVFSAIQNGTVLPEKHGRLIDADELIKITETMYLEGDSSLSFRVDGNTEDTLIGKFQMIDTIFDAPTILEPTVT